MGYSPWGRKESDTAEWLTHTHTHIYSMWGLILHPKFQNRWEKCKLFIPSVPSIHIRYAAASKSLQSCLTLCDPIDGSPPGSPIPGILQARTLEWVAVSFSNTWKWKVKVKSLSRVQLFETSWTAAYQAPPSIGFSRQEYWIGLPSPSPNIRYKTN